jgi:transcriptional regulator with XRE-family HTH domain
MARRKKRPAIQHAEIVRRFAERLREVRRSKGFTQAELSRQANTSESYIRRLEAAGAAPGMDIVDRIAAALGVPAADLIPAPTTPPDDREVLREQARRLFDIVIPTDDRQSLVLLTLFLARLSETTPR